MASAHRESDEFRIVISGKITATYCPAGATARPIGNEEDLPAGDSLPMRTVMLLDSWLNLWDQIVLRRAKSPEMILNDTTLEIIGRHLWDLILDNTIGRELRRLIPRRRGQPPLRVLITFIDGPGELKMASYDLLKGLPWEFLCVGDGQPVFLAAEARLQLVRYVEREPDGAAFSGASPLRVQFVTALPLGNRYGHIWEQVRQFRAAVHKPDGGIEAPEPVQGLDLEAIEKALSEPCHVIHLVGLCKGAPGNPLIYSPEKDRPEPDETDEEDEESWHKPDLLIKALTPDGVPRPRLVILHLCEQVRGDASENFERLAPALIARGVPAVLALQYPMAVAPDVAIGTQFYEKLAKGELIGEAVQTSRAELRKIKGRNFGTPVLYLQKDDVVVKLRKGAGGSKERPVAHGDNEEDPSSVLSMLSRALLEAPPAEVDAETAGRVYREFADLLRVGARPIDLLQLMLKGSAEPAERRVVEFMFQTLQTPTRPQKASRGVRGGRAQARTGRPAGQFVRTP